MGNSYNALRRGNNRSLGENGLLLKTYALSKEDKMAAGTLWARYELWERPL